MLSSKALASAASHPRGHDALSSGAPPASSGFPPGAFRGQANAERRMQGGERLTPCVARPCSWRTDTHVTRLGDADVGKFFDLPGAVIPEAFQAHYLSAAVRRETVIEKGGCKGLQVRQTGGNLVAFSLNLKNLTMCFDCVFLRRRPCLDPKSI